VTFKRGKKINYSEGKTERSDVSGFRKPGGRKHIGGASPR